MKIHLPNFAKGLQTSWLFFIIALLILILSVSCVSNESNSKMAYLTTEEKSKVEFWIKDYKNVVFQRCLFLGFGKSPEIRNLLKVDRSSHQEFTFGLPQYKKIDSLVLPIIAQAKMDSINFYHQYLKGKDSIEIDDKNGLPMMKLCLAYYESKELKEIAEENVLLMTHLWK